MPHCPVRTSSRGWRTARVKRAAGEARYSVRIGACEELFVERPSHDGDDVTLFGSGNVGFGNDLRRQVFPFAEGEFQHLEGCD